MPSYRVYCRDAVGASVELSLTARSLPGLVQQLAAQGLQAQRVLPGAEPSAAALQRVRVSESALAHFYRQLAIQLENGVSLPEAVEAQRREAGSPGLRLILTSILRGLRQGADLSSTLEAFPTVFSPIHTRMIEAAEAGNSLSEAMKQLADHTERTAQVAMRIRTALVYPQVIGIVALTVTLLAAMFIQPAFFRMIAEMGVGPEDLPWYPRAVQFFGAVIAPILGVLLPVGAVGLWAVGEWGGRTLHPGWSYVRCRLPVIGGLYSALALFRLTRLLAALIDAGVPLLESLRLAGQGAENPLLQAAMWDAIPRVARGESLSQALSSSAILPATFVGQLAAGESAGDLSGALGRMGRWYGEQIDYMAARVGAVLEPIFVGAVGLIVAWMVTGTFVPILTVIQSLSGGD